MLKSLASIFLIFSLFIFSGCGASEDLSSQYRDSSENGFVGGSGAISEYPVESRSGVVSFSGETTDGSVFDSDSLYVGTETGAGFAPKAFVVNFWYSACAPCRSEAKIFSELDSFYDEDTVNFLGINVRDGISQAQSFEEKFSIEYPSILDAQNTRKVQQDFVGIVPLNAVPTTIILDSEGRVAARIVGEVSDLNILKSMIDSIVLESSS